MPNIDQQNHIDNPELQKLAEQFQNDPQFKDFKNMLDKRCNETTDIGQKEMKAGLQMYQAMKDNPDMIQVTTIFMQKMNF